MANLSERLLAAQQALLRLFGFTTSIPVAICDVHRDAIGNLSASGLNGLPFESCRERLGVLLNEEYATLLRHDEIAIRCPEAEICTLVVPIRIHGEVMALLLYGAVSISEPQWEQLALEQRAAPDDLVVNSFLQLFDGDATPDNFKELIELLKQVLRVLYVLQGEGIELQETIQQVVHELRTRLTALISESENLAGDAPELSPTQLQQRLVSVTDAAEAMNDIISAIANDHTHYHFTQVQLQYLVTDALRIFEREVNEKLLEIRIQNGKGVQPWPSVQVSRKHLAYALNHLIHNSIKYSLPNTSITIKGSISEDSGMFCLSIENTGYGIHEEEISEGHIFRAGYRGRLVQGHVITGMGYGLYYVLQVVQKHRGVVKVISEPDTSWESRLSPIPPYKTRITVCLPLLQSEQSSPSSND